MPVTDGPGSATPLARYDPESCCWRTSVVTLFQQEQGEPLGTLPRSGTTRSGELYERPMLAPLTVGNAGSVLPTPRASDTNGPGAHGTGGPDLRTAVTLLPTPRSTDGPKGGPGQVNGRGVADSLPAIGVLLPTPTAQAAKHGTDDRGPGTLDDHNNLWSVATRMHGQLLPTPTSRDWKDGAPNDNVPTNALLGREVWKLGATTGPPSPAGNTSPDDPHPPPPTTEDD